VDVGFGIQFYGHSMSCLQTPSPCCYKSNSCVRLSCICVFRMPRCSARCCCVCGGRVGRSTIGDQLSKVGCLVRSSSSRVVVLIEGRSERTVVVDVVAVSRTGNLLVPSIHQDIVLVVVLVSTPDSPGNDAEGSDEDEASDADDDADDDVLGTRRQSRTQIAITFVCRSRCSCGRHGTAHRDWTAVAGYGLYDHHLRFGRAAGASLCNHDGLRRIAVATITARTVRNLRSTVTGCRGCRPCDERSGRRCARGLWRVRG
jgi:hypothetical protein